MLVLGKADEAIIFTIAEKGYANMVERLMYRLAIAGGQGERFHDAVRESADDLTRALREAGARMCAVYRWERQLFAYVEADARALPFRPDVPPALKALLAPWPGEARPRIAAPMNDIFHDGVPVDWASWRKGRVAERRIGSLARLKPEQYASYVFYHYQLQEEQPEKFNQTYIIGSHERLIFSYQELPASLSGRPRRGTLDTNRTPDGWQDVMDPHFEPWTDVEPAERIWRQLACVFAFDDASGPA